MVLNMKQNFYYYYFFFSIIKLHLSAAIARRHHFFCYKTECISVSYANPLQPKMGLLIQIHVFSVMGWYISDRQIYGPIDFYSCTHTFFGSFTLYELYLLACSVFQTQD